MRIIGGKFRRRTLKGPSFLKTRPTSDRLRETLFNILAPRIERARFLDLCAGSGAVGIEALSRGAAHVIFVDRSRQMCALIQDNVRTLKIEDTDVEIVCAEAGEFLRRSGKRSSSAFDLIFFDPPYADDYESILDLVGQNTHSLLSEGGIVIVEHYKKKELRDEYGGLQRYRQVKQGDSSLSFYEAT